LFIILTMGAASASSLTGQLTGEWQAWEALTIEARQTRDLGQTPVAVSPVDASGRFELRIPDDFQTVYLTALPEKNSPYPLFLSAMPVPVVSDGDQEFAMSPPAFYRQERQQIGAKKFWLISLVLLLFLAGATWSLRRFWGKRSDNVSRDTHPWLPPLFTAKRDRGIAGVIVALIGGLVGMTLLGPIESLDLLEYTYFQEAYGGNNPISVAISAVVAERAHAPGYSILLWFMTQVSANFHWLRLPALLAAMGCVWIVHRITLQITAQRMAAAVAAIAAGLAPLAIRYSDDLSPYSLTALLTVASTGFLLRSLITDQRRAWVGFCLTSIGAFFLHYFAAVFVLGQIIAVFWIGLVSNRDAFWAGRLRKAVGWFAIVGILPLLWAPQVFRGFEVSMHDNMVTGTVYAAAEGFWPYLTDHLRVLLGLSSPFSWATWPCILVLALAYKHTLRTHPLLGRILLIPLLMVVALIALTYILQSVAYGGRTYYGFRWLRGYVPAIIIPMALAATHSLGSQWTQLWRPKTWFRGWVPVFVLVMTIFWITSAHGVRLTLTAERPAQQALVHTLLSNAQNGDGVAVLPAGFYSVQTSYYLHEYGPRQSIHEGAASWDHYTKPDGSDVVLYGPIRSYGVPLESVARHVDLSRLWVVVFNETAFGRPEFEPQISEQTLAALTEQSFPTPWYRRTQWEFTAMTLVLFELDVSNNQSKTKQRDPTDPWFTKTAGCSAEMCVPLKHPYKLLRFAPDGLDPSGLISMINKPETMHLRFPTPVGTNNTHVRIVGAPKDAKQDDFQIEKATLHFNNGIWSGTVPMWRNRPSFDMRIRRSEKAAFWPLTLEMSRRPFSDKQ